MKGNMHLSIFQKLFSIRNCVDYKLIVLFNIKIKIPFRYLNHFYIRNAKKRYGIIPNKIVFSNYMGNNYGCNPKYICEELLKTNNFDLVWLVKDEISKEDFPKGVRIVPYQSKAALKELATAKIWVDNYHKSFHLSRGGFGIKSKEQVFIQTWHGSFGIKKIEKDVPSLTEDAIWLKYSQKSSEMVDIWVSNSDFETNVYKNAFWGVKNIYKWGHPRNDVFFFSDEKILKIKEKVCNFFNIDINTNILLYVPSFREDETLNFYNIDFDKCIECIKSNNILNGNNKKWVVLSRLHARNSKSDNIISESKYILNATKYPDIQELLVSADIAISDYSSCIFDFILSGKPVFIYAPDIEKYNNERGFYYPLSETPFSIATDNSELVNNINHFDMVQYKQDVEKFLRDKGNAEAGNASKKVAEFIITELKKENKND